MSVYVNPLVGPPAPTPPLGWSYLSCVVDSVAARALPTAPNLPSPNTISECANACLSLGFNVAGVEYSTVSQLGIALKGTLL